MRTRNALERLAAVAPADPLVDSDEEDRILERILASSRPAAPARNRRRAVVVLVGVALLAAASILAWVEVGGGSHQHIALTGARIEMAGYRFRTPAGFKSTSSPCDSAVQSSFAAAASADGGCIEGAVLIRLGTLPDGSEPVSVGHYGGYYIPPDSSGVSTLYVALPEAASGQPVYLGLFANGLTEDQLVAVAESGLPAFPSPTTTMGTEG